MTRWLTGPASAVFGVTTRPVVDAVGWAVARTPGQAAARERHALQGKVDADAPVVARAELVVAAPAKAVWGVLADIGNWPRWAPGVHHVDGPDSLVSGARFGWWNGPVVIHSVLAVVTPSRELSWTGWSVGAHGVHRHELTSAGRGRTRVMTEESLRGPLVAQLFPSATLATQLDQWLEALGRAAVRG